MTPTDDSSFHDLSLPELEIKCRKETDNWRKGKPSDTRYCLEIFRRAVALKQKRQGDIPAVYDNEEARNLLVHIYTEFVKAHISSDALRGTTIDDLVNQAWQRFWQAANNGLTFNSLPAALAFLRKCTLSAVLAHLRSHRKYERDISLQQLREARGEETAADRQADPFSVYAKDRFDRRIIEVLVDALDRRIFVMRYGLLLPPRRIADILRAEEILINERQPTARAVSNCLDRCFAQLAEDPEVKDLLQND